MLPSLTGEAEIFPVRGGKKPHLCGHYMETFEQTSLRHSANLPFRPRSPWSAGHGF